MERILDLIGGADNVASMVVYVLIVLLFVFGMVKCIAPVLRNRRTLRRAISIIKSGSKKRSWQEDDFLGNGSLSSHWSEYLNNLFFADGDYHNPSNVEDFINEETVIYGPGSSGFADAIPGLMVSLGFMGTLIGLAKGLSGFDMGNEQAIMGSIETLIPGMRYAFMTSIVGVICSVTFTLIMRTVNGSASRAITGFYGAMSRYAGVLSVDPMTQIAIYQQEQTSLIQEMSREMGGRFSESIASAVGRAIAPMKESLDNFITVNTKEQMRFLDTVVTRFVSHMDQELNGQFDNLSAVIGETVRTQEMLLNAVEGHVDSISKTTVEMEMLEKSARSTLNGLDAYFAKINAAQRQIDEALTKVNSGTEMMSVVSGAQADYLRQAGQMHAALTESIASIASLSDTVRQSAEQLAELRRDMETEAARAAQYVATANAETLRQTEKDIRGVLGVLSDYQKDYNARMDEVADAIGSSVESLPAAVSAVTENMTDQIDRMNAALNRAQRALDDAVDRMYGR